jgi:hypothetical protein
VYDSSGGLQLLEIPEFERFCGAQDGYRKYVLEQQDEAFAS